MNFICCCFNKRFLYYCPICLNNLDQLPNPVIALKCGHVICYTCFFKICKCPICRLPIFEQFVLENYKKCYHCNYDITYNNIKANYCFLKCGHTYCKECISNLLYIKNYYKCKKCKTLSGIYKLFI